MKKMLIFAILIMVVEVVSGQSYVTTVLTPAQKNMEENFYLKDFLNERSGSIEYDQNFKKLILNKTTGWTGFSKLEVKIFENKATLADREALEKIKPISPYNFSWTISQLIGRTLDPGGLNVFFVKSQDENKENIVCVYLWKSCEDSTKWHISATDTLGSFFGNTKYYGIDGFYK